MACVCVCVVSDHGPEETALTHFALHANTDACAGVPPAEAGAGQEAPLRLQVDLRHGRPQHGCAFMLYTHIHTELLMSLYIKTINNLQATT